MASRKNLIVGACVPVLTLVAVLLGVRLARARKVRGNPLEFERQLLAQNSADCIYRIHGRMATSLHGSGELVGLSA